MSLGVDFKSCSPTIFDQCLQSISIGIIMEAYLIPILLSGHPVGSSLGLVAAFEWLGQPYRIARVQMPDDMTGDGYAHLNGRRETPVLIRETGEALTETMAIGLWLEGRDKDHRISFPRGSSQAHRAHQLMAFINSSFTPSFSALWVALEAKGISDGDRETLRTFGRKAVARRHAQLEEMIGDTPYLMGDRPTLPDGFFAGVARWADFHKAVVPGTYPRIEALKNRLATDPAVAFAAAVEEGRKAPGSDAMKAFVPLDEALAAAKP